MLSAAGGIAATLPDPWPAHHDRLAVLFGRVQVAGEGEMSKEPDSVPPYAMLRNFYFPACLTMWEGHRRHWASAGRGGPSGPAVGELIVFNAYWFASLHVVVEGWRALGLSCPQIDPLIEGHSDSLRLFRNAVFHFQPKDAKHQQWFDADKWNWAESLTLSAQSRRSIFVLNYTRILELQ